jgi:hypothetical protein
MNEIPRNSGRDSLTEGLSLVIQNKVIGWKTVKPSCDEINTTQGTNVVY